MIVGCYTMDLYCDASDHKSVATRRGGWQYTGETAGECKRKAKADGWKFHRDGEVSCPECAKAMKGGGDAK